MNVVPTALPEVLLISPKVWKDARGAFWESWHQRQYVEAGLPEHWVQDNCSRSVRNVVRGLHYQVIQPQAKLVRATFGTILDVAVDLRRSSPNFGRYVAVELSAESGQSLYVPIGFAHGFVALTDEAGLAYKVTDYYSPAGERSLRWNDSEIGIAWPVAEGEAILADKDRNAPLLRDAEVFA